MTARTLDEEFLALVCEDDDLVRAEFDAIIEANWGEPPPSPAPRQPVPPVRYRNTARPRHEDRIAISVMARQRSPPAMEGR